jgi:hypothetical protein
MLTLLKAKTPVLLGLLCYILIAVASSTGGGNNPPPPPPPLCNETVVSLTIRVNWGSIDNYQYRSSSCPIPSQVPGLPSSSVCNGPTENAVNKGIVVITSELADNNCRLNKVYTSRQYYINPHNDDVVLEVPKRTIKIKLEYYEVCSNCTTIVTGLSRALYKSETLVPEGQVVQNGVIQLNKPAFFTATKCN